MLHVRNVQRASGAAPDQLSTCGKAPPISAFKAIIEHCRSGRRVNDAGVESDGMIFGKTKRNI